MYVRKGLVREYGRRYRKAYEITQKREMKAELPFIFYQVVW
jgi:hypothetical protein